MMTIFQIYGGSMGAHLNSVRFKAYVRVSRIKQQFFDFESSFTLLHTWHS